MSLATLHRSEGRYAAFGEESRRPIHFDEAVASWVVTAPDDIAALLRRRELRESPTDGIARHEELARRFGLEFPNLIYVFHHLPLALEGTAHRDIRRRMADLLGRKRDDLSAAAPALVERWFSGLGHPGEFDVVRQAIEPMIAGVMTILTGVDLSAEPTLWRISSVFDRLIGVRKRVEQERAVARLRAIIGEAIGPNAAPDDEAVIISFLILGRDSLGGTLGESLYRLFAAHPGERLADIEFPAIPNETGVPYVERVVARPFDYGGTAFHEGDRVRLQTQAFAYSGNAADRMRIFGVGLHACLGKRLSMELWGHITRVLATKSTTVEVIDYAVRDWDYIFTYPTRVLVRVRS
jgi:cytochrome P450